MGRHFPDRPPETVAGCRNGMMKILWVNTNFLHPTTKGGQIRSLEILRQLHHCHEIHYVAIADPAHPEALEASREYCTRCYPFEHPIPSKRSAAFLGQLARACFSEMPLAVSRFYSPELGNFLERLMRTGRFDRAVVDHLAPTSYFPALNRSLFFQHNVETMIWRRHAAHAPDPARKLYFRMQARRMFQYERRVSRAAGHIVAVSAVDAALMRKLFGVTRVSEIPTGVNIEYFAAPPSSERFADLVFIGSMDWLPNIDGVRYFVREVLPLIRRRRPGCTFGIAGRTPVPWVAALPRQDPHIFVTGTVPDVRPYLWGSTISIVPLRIGGGTRLKIYESMAAGVPVVSTTIGAEGLSVNPPGDMRIADSPEAFAQQCLDLLDNADERSRLSAAAREMVRSKFSWQHVASCFERTLEAAPALE
jgi:glycosyltransferase involved in cell wall biosynthesis